MKIRHMKFRFLQFIYLNDKENGDDTWKCQGTVSRFETAVFKIFATFCFSSRPGFPPKLHVIFAEQAKRRGAFLPLMCVNISL